MKHQYLFELGGENTELGKIEALELLSNENYKPKLILDETSIITIDVSNIIKPKIIRRLGMTKRISKILHQDKDIHLEKVVDKIPILDIGQRTFAIRQIGNQLKSEKKIATLLGEKIPKHNKTHLSNPEVKILYYTGIKTIISIWDSKLETYYKKCLKHHISNRPFFSPISIHPRIARSMINLANCSDGDSIIDPFCGTGGMLIEASDMGINSFGIDIMKKMVDYSIGNLEHFGLESKVTEGDIADIHKYKFNAIVTDPPYGISTTTLGEGIEKLMTRCLELFAKKLKSKQRLVMAVSNPKLTQNNNYTIIHQFEWYIHKSLTRHILVMEKN